MISFPVPTLLSPLYWNWAIYGIEILTGRISLHLSENGWGQYLSHETLHRGEGAWH